MGGEHRHRAVLDHRRAGGRVRPGRVLRRVPRHRTAALRLVLTVGGGTAHRVLVAVVAAAGDLHEVVVADEGHPRLDVEAGVVHLLDRTVAVVLRTPRPGEVGVVEDLLVDRAFEDVAGEATLLAELGDVRVTSVDDLHALLGAAALARAAGIPADAVREGVRAVGPSAD